MNEKQKFTPVPVERNSQGKVRQVGFELEYSGIHLDDSANLIVSLFGGNVVRKNAFSRVVEDTSVGNFALELDMPLLKDEVYKTYLDALGIELDDQQMQSVEELLDGAASSIVPYEVVLPPLPLTDLTPVEELRKAMFNAGAQGTRASVVNAFGLHINPEIPDGSVDVLLRHLQAFLLLEDWIRQASQTDWTRRLTPFINAFPLSYQGLVLDLDYQPDLASFLQDYVSFNKTRYRSLDFLPVFGHLDKADLIRLFPEAEKIGSRPTFHYRLPNCLVSDTDWSVAKEWHYWAVVEHLAHDRKQLERLIWALNESERAFRELRESYVRRFDE